MTTAWRRTRFGDVARVKHGYAFKGAAMTQHASGSLPIVVGIGNFDYAGGFRFDTTVVKRYEADYPPEFELQPGDLLLAMTCQTSDGEILGIPGRIPDDGNTYLHNQRLGKVEVIDSELLDLGYAFQLARWTAFNRHLFATSSGSKILHTSPDRIEDFEFAIPPISEQRAIAATLGALDDKVESNQRVVALIPNLIRVRVLDALDDASEEVTVSTLADFVNGGAYTKDATGTGRMVVRIAELTKGPGGSTVYNDLDIPDDKIARAGDILMPWSGSLGVHRWAREEAIINQHIFKVIPAAYPDWLVFDRLDAVMPVFRRIAKDKATTMGHIQRGHLASTNVMVPSGAAVTQLDKSLAPLWQRLLQAERESLKLAELRDALLPELLSGRIRIRETAETMERAA